MTVLSRQFLYLVIQPVHLMLVVRWQSRQQRSPQLSFQRLFRGIHWLQTRLKTCQTPFLDTSNQLLTMFLTRHCSNHNVFVVLSCKWPQITIHYRCRCMTWIHQRLIYITHHRPHRHLSPLLVVNYHLQILHSTVWFVPSILQSLPGSKFCIIITFSSQSKQSFTMPANNDITNNKIYFWSPAQQHTFYELIISNTSHSATRTRVRKLPVILPMLRYR